MQLIDKETRQALEELGARLTTMPGRYEAVHMPGEAGALTFITEAEASPEMKVAVVKRTLEVAALASKIAKVTTDQNLSDEGKRNLRRTLDADRRKLANRIEADAVQIDGVATLAKVAEDQLYAPTPIERTDAAGALVDAEIRSYFSGRTLEQLGAALADVNQRQLEALKRAPVPLGEPLGQMIDAAWERHLQTDKAREFETVQADLDNARFGVNAIGQLKQAVARLEFHDAVIRPHLEEAA
jgi:hypothetical protein